MLVHHASWHADVEEFRKLSKKYNLPLIQDFSQSHGYVKNYSNKMLPDEIAVFSTMYRKSQSSGGSGGFILTNSNKLGNLIKSLSDRGKILDNSGKWLINSRDGNEINFPSLNHCLDDISCLFGIESLGKLDKTRKKRVKFTKNLCQNLKEIDQYINIPELSSSTSPFIIPISIKLEEFKEVKEQLSKYLFSLKVPHNPDYKFLAPNWKWLQPSINYSCSLNAQDYLDRTIFLYVNERYNSNHASFISKKIKDFFKNQVL